MKNRILVIRGGGIGDFILTLPAIRLLREGFPDCHLEVLGYRRVLGLVEKAGLADSTRSIDYGPMAACFNPRAEIEAGLSAYFRSFGQVVSYIYDPDGLFEGTLRRLGVKNILSISPRLNGQSHAARQLAEPLARLSLSLDNHWPEIRFAEGTIQQPHFPSPGSWVALHPGSGGKNKLWPVAGWEEVIDRLLKSGHQVVVLGGEADEEPLRFLSLTFGGRVKFIFDLPLESLAAGLSQCQLFLGHDSGISHLAAASGARCLLLFGPTDPRIWAPANPQVRVLVAPQNNLSHLSPKSVLEEINHMLP